MKVEIDPKAGFCFGVTRVVKKAEEIIKQSGILYCLGEIVHNEKEIERLEGLGLKTITREEFMKLSDCRVLIRAHGEPPETYEYAATHNIELVDGTCPIVLRLQSRIKQAYNSEKNARVVIFGKKNHAEVRGLAGQTGYQAQIVESAEDIAKINFDRPVHLYSQTTMSMDNFAELQQNLIKKAEAEGYSPERLNCTNSICRQVSGRIPQLSEFCKTHKVILFVSYKESSNGRLLYSKCLEVNKNSHFVAETTDLKPEWFSGCESVGITGATSTPRWLLEEFERNLIALDIP